MCGRFEGRSPVTSDKRLLCVRECAGVASVEIIGVVGGVDGASSESEDIRLRLAELEIGTEFSRIEESIGEAVRSISSEDCRFRLLCLVRDEDGIGRVGRGDASATLGRISTIESDGDGMLIGVLQTVSLGETYLNKPLT